MIHPREWVHYIRWRVRKLWQRITQRLGFV